MRLVAALLLLAGALPARAADAPRDPLAVLVELLSAPIDEKAAAAPGAPAENSEHLARIQGGLIAAAEGYESLRAPTHAAAAQSALVKETDPALKPFFKNRDASLDATYRTLAVVDYTWALRFPPAACAATERRRALLQAPDGLFVDPDVGDLSPWMARLLGPSSFGRSPEEALDQASQSLKLTPSAYEKLRVRASRLTEELAAGSADGAARGRLYCERADLYEQLARAHRVEHGPTLASLKTGGEETNAAASVFLVAAPNGNDYRALGAGFLVQTEKGAQFVTDATIARGHEKLYAFAHPASDGKLGEPMLVVIERIANGIGPAVGKLDRATNAPSLSLAEASPAQDELVRGLGPLRTAGPWTVTQGLVTGAGFSTFQSDAVLSAEMAGSPVLNDRGEAAGLIIRRGEDVTALRVEKLRAFLEGKPAEPSDAEFVASRNSGSASLLTTARPVDEYAWSAPGASAIESGLPTNLGGVSWEGGGGVGGFRPSGYAGPPSGSSSGFAPRSSGYSDGGSAERIGNDLGSALGDAAGKLMVYGMQKLFQGIYSLFHPQASGSTNVVTKSKRVAPPPPPPPPEPKIIGLALSVEPPDAAPGERVTLVAQLQFQGDYKKKAGNPILFTGGNDKAYFGTSESKQKSESDSTDENGRATAILTLEESVAVNSENEFNDLEREQRHQDGEEPEGEHASKVASGSSSETPIRRVKDRAAREIGELDSESTMPNGQTSRETDTTSASEAPGAVQAAAATPAAPPPSSALTIRKLEAIRVAAGFAGFKDSKDITPKAADSPGQPPDCNFQSKNLHEQAQDARQQREIASAILLPVLAKYDIDYDQFRSEFPRLLKSEDAEVCSVDTAACQLRANAKDWALAKASYGQVQTLDQKLQSLSIALGQLAARCPGLSDDGDEEDPGTADRKENDSPSTSGQPATSDTFVSQRHLDEHYQDHVVNKKEFGPITKEEYLRRALELRNAPADGQQIMSHTRANGTIVKYNATTNEFGAFNTDGSIRTLFKPDDGVSYYQRQLNK